MTQKFHGMGGHMTASLIHDIDVLYRIYDNKIADAWRHGHQGTAESLANTRDAQIRKIAARLEERGYHYVLRSRPAASLKPRDAEIPEELKRAVRAHVVGEIIRRKFLGLNPIPDAA